MPSIAAIDRRCFVSPARTQGQPTQRPRPDAPRPPALSWRPPMERTKPRG